MCCECQCAFYVVSDPIPPEHSSRSCQNKASETNNKWVEKRMGLGAQQWANCITWHHTKWQADPRISLTNSFGNFSQFSHWKLSAPAPKEPSAFLLMFGRPIWVAGMCRRDAKDGGHRWEVSAAQSQLDFRRPHGKIFNWKTFSSSCGFFHLKVSNKTDLLFKK